MLTGGDCSTHALLRAHRPELGEGSGTFDRWLIHALTSVQLVCPFLEREVALLRPRFARCDDIVRLDDIVLDERVASPAVECEVSRTLGVVCAGVLDSPDILSAFTYSR